MSRLKDIGGTKKVIGLTGGLGSGKSTVLAMFQALGAKTVDADALVHALLKKDKRIIHQVKRNFGANITDRRGNLIRRKLADVIFLNESNRRGLESILHPRVKRKMIKDVQRSKKSVIVCDVPLLFEKGWEQEFHKTLVVYSKPSVRKARLIKKGISPSDLRRRWRVQWPLNRKKKRADYVINNNGSLRATRQEVRRLWKSLTLKPSI